MQATRTCQSHALARWSGTQSRVAGKGTKSKSRLPSDAGRVTCSFSALRAVPWAPPVFADFDGDCVTDVACIVSRAPSLEVCIFTFGHSVLKCGPIPADSKSISVADVGGGLPLVQPH